MRDVRHITIITRNPIGSGDGGSCEEGFYTVDGDGVLTMTDAEGAALRNPNTGEKITHRLAPGESDKAVAKRLRLRIYRDARPDDDKGFSRPLRYPKFGLA
jgi:hypothetical protein